LLILEYVSSHPYTECHVYCVSDLSNCWGCPGGCRLSIR